MSRGRPLPCQPTVARCGAGPGEGGTDGITVAFSINWDHGRQTQYTGAVDQSTGAVTGERPDGVTWHTTANLRCIDATDPPPG